MSDAPTVAVLGALHLDVLVDAPRLPRHDETLLGTGVRYAQGGKGGNQAVAAAGMGAPTAMIGCVGDDAFGQTLIAALNAAGVDTGRVRTLSAAASGMSVALLEPDGSYGAVVVSGANLAVGDEARLPDSVSVLCLQNEVPEAANLAAAREARRQGARILLNAAPARPLSEDLAVLVDVLVVNRLEAGDLTGAPSPTEAATLLRSRLRADATVIVTLGADGLIAATGPAPPIALPAPVVAQISSHGAGDRFAGTLAAELAHGAGWPEALAMAQAAAALHVACDAGQRARIDRAAVHAFCAAQTSIR